MPGVPGRAADHAFTRWGAALDTRHRLAAACRHRSTARLLSPLLPLLACLQYRELFNVPVDRLCAIRDALVEQMEAGLAGKVR